MSTQGMHSSLGSRFGFSKKKIHVPFTVPVLTQDYIQNHQSVPNTSTSNETGTAKVVLNGYGILFYGWQTYNQGASMHNVTLPSDLVGVEMDITIIGSGGWARGGGSGGGGGGSGGRHVQVLDTTQIYLKTGARYQTPQMNSSPGQDEFRNARLHVQSGSSDINMYGPHGSQGSSGTGSGCNVYNTRAPSRNQGNGAIPGSNNTKLQRLQAIDTQLEYVWGGNGGCLPSFGGWNCGAQRTGSDIGGGGGATNCQNYGGPCDGGAGGRYGFDGGEGNSGGDGGNGYGPVGGKHNPSPDTYRRGGGGSFGGGNGDNGSTNGYQTMGGGGAILMRWDTYDLGTFQAKEGWPPA
tara:strand:+ start:791 stop:1840 length:1050 start_codon:yes stop_codon:yes gene_type:complete